MLRYCVLLYLYSTPAKAHEWVVCGLRTTAILTAVGLLIWASDLLVVEQMMQATAHNHTACMNPAHCSLSPCSVYDAGGNVRSGPCLCQYFDGYGNTTVCGGTLQYPVTVAPFESATVDNWLLLCVFLIFGLLFLIIGVGCAVLFVVAHWPGANPFAR